MSTAPSLQPLLLGLFRELVANQVPLGVRDYLDGVRALQFGFGQRDRHCLCNLAQALWARSDEERRLIARYLSAIPLPPAELIAALEVQTQVNDSDSPKGSPSGRSDMSFAGTAAGSPQPRARARVSFSGAREGDGLPLPRLTAEPVIAENYILHPHVLISPRNLAVLWRRFRRTTRRGPRTELDITSTIRERCRWGLLQQPVYRPLRSNCVRLLILADTSPSMIPWLPFVAGLDESLQLGLFANAEVLYFSNLPRKQLYATPELTDPQPRDEVLQRFIGGSLLVISDAGSARGYLNRRRVVQTGNFLAEAARLFRSVVWLNPMPRPRWAGTTAGLLAGSPFCSTVPLDTFYLPRVIDILRGNK